MHCLCYTRLVRCTSTPASHCYSNRFSMPLQSSCAPSDQSGARMSDSRWNQPLPIVEHLVRWLSVHHRIGLVWQAQYCYIIYICVLSLVWHQCCSGLIQYASSTEFQCTTRLVQCTRNNPVLNTSSFFTLGFSCLVSGTLHDIDNSSMSLSMSSLMC